MAKKQSKTQLGQDVILADGEPLHLRNRPVAAFLAWLVPGAGHFYQRRYLKACIFSTCILSSFVIGMLVGDAKSVYASWNTTEKRWQFALQAGIGLPALPAALQYWRQRDGSPPMWGGFMAAPSSTSELDDWHAKTASGFDMGTLYTMVAGLLNVLVILDAYAGPLPPPVPRSKKPDNDEEKPDNAKPKGQSEPAT